MADLPPLPPGFTLDSAPAAASGGMPPLPPGFKLDSGPAPEASTGRTLGIGARGAITGAADLVDLPSNALGLADRAGTYARNKIRAALGLAPDAVNAPAPPQYASRAANAAGNAIGLPTPQTPGEQVEFAAARGAAGAVALGGGAGVNALRAGIAGATGGASSDIARQSGAGPVGQFAAGVVGGAVPGIVEGVTRSAVRAGANAVRPLTTSGQQGIAAQTLQTQARDPQAAAANLANAKEIIPGSPRNMGEASQDVGLLALEKGIKGKYSADFGERVSQQNAAQQAALQGVSGTEADIATAKAARAAETGPMRDQALKGANDNTIKAQSLTADIENRFRSKASALQDKGRFDTLQAQSESRAGKPYVAVSGQPPVSGRYSPFQGRAEEAASASSDAAPIIAQRQAQLQSAQDQLAKLKASGASPLEITQVTNKINGLLQTPGLRASQVVTKALSAVGDKINSLADEHGVIDARDLYTVRKELGNYIQQAAKDSSSWDKKLTSGLQIDLQHSIDDAIENAAPGFKAYIQRYSELSKPIDQMKAMQEIRTRAQLTAGDISTRQDFLGSAKFSNALDKALQKGNLTPTQITQLKAIKTDLKYGQAINGPLVKAPGSDTFQNLSIAQVLGAGPNPANAALRVVSKPLEWIYKAAGSDTRVNDLLRDAALDPKFAAALLRRATPQTTYQLSEALKRMAVSAGLGGAAGIPGQLSGSSKAQTSPGTSP